ncbi:MAG: HAMP domain-containing histidine kinase [Lachnospiraceae bacterium]|nr:HAMP domain-containing histidine kinase [Lachnospiraceae bacterium]
MNNKKIIARCALTYLAFAFLSILIISLIVKPLLIKAYANRETKLMYESCASFSNSHCLLYYSGSLDSGRFVTNMRTYSDYTRCDMWLMNENGTIAYATNYSSYTAPTKLTVFDAIEYFNGDYSETGTFCDYYREDFISVYVPVNVRYKICGYLIMSKPVSSIEESAYTYLSTIYLILFIVLILALIAVIITALHYLKPADEMLKASSEYLSGNYKPQIPLTGDESLDYLINAFNFMATRLDTHEDEQRKFISNVSHDFRSPLTSIRGYLQAMLDGTIPPELHEKYLKRILDESDRLTGLTNSLLDLNRIGSRDFALDISDFDINDIIIASAESAEVQANNKNVGINLVLCGEVMKVHADKGKIQQVLYNLLDNAIKFSKENTTITIETKVRNSSKLLVSVSDQGVGIPEESIDKLFNRFYKADQSRGQNKKGTGLGLSIVKEIIQAHDETITVSSTLDVGTTFTFSLALAEEELENY